MDDPKERGYTLYVRTEHCIHTLRGFSVPLFVHFPLLSASIHIDRHNGVVDGLDLYTLLDNQRGVSDNPLP